MQQLYTGRERSANDHKSERSCSRMARSYQRGSLLDTCSRLEGFPRFFFQAPTPYTLPWQYSVKWHVHAEIVGFSYYHNILLLSKLYRRIRSAAIITVCRVSYGCVLCVFSPRGILNDDDHDGGGDSVARHLIVEIFNDHDHEVISQHP